MTAPDGEGFHGKGETLHDAVKDAWEKAPKDGHTTYEVTKIHVEGHNPITGYVVVLGSHGGG
jgi:hypothetical protein